MTRAEYIMIGGFLGAGKTTAVLRLAQHLRRHGRTVGLITNDQSIGLVDTALLASQGFQVEEITGGCFCCRFNSLVEAAESLSRDARPDAFIAEPVGSCTDLRATVNYPLRRIYGDSYRVAPLSVLVDPIRALRILGRESGPAFSPKVLYVYRKQLEEADIIVINKRDLLTPERLADLEDALHAEFPAARLFAVSARDGSGLEAWFDAIIGADMGDADAPSVDYDTYAEGEALLGWLNVTAHVTAAGAFDGNALLRSVASAIQHQLGGLEVAHLKMTLLPDENGADIGVLNLTRTDGSPEMSHTLKEPLDSGELVINLRAEGDPEALHRSAMAALESCAAAGALQLRVAHAERFRPGRPVPTHRMATA